MTTWQGDAAKAYAIAHRFEKLMAGLAGERADGYNWAFGGMQATLKPLSDKSIPSWLRRWIPRP